jgi:hypothetical protein
MAENNDAKNFSLRGTVALVLRRGAPKWVLAALDHARANRLTAYDAKVSYKIRYDRNPRLTQTADKLGVRRYAAERIGENYLPRVYGSGSSLTQEWFTDIPREFLVKTNHGCGGLIMVTDSANANARLPEVVEPGDWSMFSVRPENFEFEKAKRITDVWLSQKFNDNPAIGKPFEWAYDDIVPQVFLEEMLLGPDGGVPADIKFWCFDGRCEYIAYIYDRFGSISYQSYDRNWNRLDVAYNGYNFAPIDVVSPKPEHFDELLEVTEKLAAGIDHVRVDLYLTNTGVKLGELTNYPLAGNIWFEPASYSQVLGSKWKPNYRGKRATKN